MTFNLNDSYDFKNLDLELAFEKIKHRHRSIITQFQSYQSELRGFLIDDALRSQELAISNTYLIFDKRNYIQYKKNKRNLILLGYITISNDAINLDATLKGIFKDKGIPYKALPALKIGRLCIDDRYQGRGLGRCLLVWTAKRVAYLNQNSACRFITLDAKRHPEKTKDSFHFYKKFGFKILKKKGEKSDSEIAQQKSGTNPMYFDLFRIIKKVEVNTGT